MVPSIAQTKRPSFAIQRAAAPVQIVDEFEDYRDFSAAMAPIRTQAQHTVEHVEGLGIRASNRAAGGYARPGDDAKLGPMIDAMREWCRNRADHPDNKLSEPALRAGLARQQKAGNCTEQSAIAYEYLRGAQVHGVAWMNLRDPTHAPGTPDPHSHVFVLMGLTAQPPAAETFVMGGGPPASWGPTAVVCDAYFGNFYDARNWDIAAAQMFPGLHVGNGTVVTVTLRRYIA